MLEVPTYVEDGEHMLDICWEVANICWGPTYVGDMLDICWEVTNICWGPTYVGNMLRGHQHMLAVINICWRCQHMLRVINILWRYVERSPTYVGAQHMLMICWEVTNICWQASKYVGDHQHMLGTITYCYFRHMFKFMASNVKHMQLQWNVWKGWVVAT